MPIKTVTSVLLVGLAAGLAGCGGGGGGGSPPPAPPEVPFTSFQAVQPNQTVVMPSSNALEANGTATPLGTITSATLGSPEWDASTVKLTYDSNRALSAFSIATPSSSVTFNNSPGNSLTCSSGICEGTTPTGSGVVVDGLAIGWNYQTFGIWAEAPTATSWVTGAISVGNPTPGSAVPISGSATFNGVAAGLYVDIAGNVHGTAAQMTANVDFQAQTIGFSTSGTMVSDVNGMTYANSNLDLVGTTWHYPASTNQFGGNLHTADNSLSGFATGQFYGPSAQEIGGTYGLTGTGVSGMLGAFGGKR